MRTSWWGTDLNLAPTQEALRTSVHEFARERIRPAAIELDRMSDPQSILAAGSSLRDVLKGYVRTALAVRWFRSDWGAVWGYVELIYISSTRSSGGEAPTLR
ncbi:MAG TPA: hypothetical protein VLA73_04385 [Burkholderiales bacterium]|nr:hypothetical protein [Burkholderiales bacterium]